MLEGTRLLLKSGFLCILSCATYIQDMVLDLNLAVKYYECNQLYFILTMIFLLVPGIITSLFSVIWHIQDASRTPTVTFPISLKIFKFISISLLISPISGYVNCLYLLIHQYRSNDNHESRQILVDSLTMATADVAFLRLFESFLESAPQFMLQLYIILKGFNFRHCSDYKGEPYYLESAGIAMSTLSLGISMTSYNLSLRKAQPEKMKHDIIGAITLFGTYIFSISARILALTLGTVVIPYYSCSICGLHWFVMTLWLIHIMGRREEITINQIFSCMALGIVYIFVFINPEDKKTRNKYIGYNIICFAENLAMTVSWWYFQDHHSRFYYQGLIIHYCSYVLGILLQILYYRYFHPSLQKSSEEIKSEIQMGPLVPSTNMPIA